MDLSELAPLVAAFVNRASAESVRQEALAGVLGVVTSGSASIEAIVSALGPHLTTTDELVRSKGACITASIVRPSSLFPRLCHASSRPKILASLYLVSLLNLLATLLLAELLTRHASWSLTPQSIHSLVVFFSDRLQDYPCQTEVLNGIRALLSHHHIAPGDDHTLCRAIFSEVHVQTLPQTGILPPHLHHFPTFLHFSISPFLLSILTSTSAQDGVQHFRHSLGPLPGLHEAHGRRLRLWLHSGIPRITRIHIIFYILQPS